MGCGRVGSWPLYSQVLSGVNIQQKSPRLRSYAQSSEKLNEGIKLAPFCDMFASFLDVAYTDFMQDHLFQGDYFRDPRRLTTSGFKKKSQIAQWNNEGDTVNSTFKTNFEKTKMYVMVEALKENLVFIFQGQTTAYWSVTQLLKGVVGKTKTV